MEEILSRPWWEFVGASTGIVLGIIAIIIAIRQTKKKSLVYQVVYSIPLFRIVSQIKDDLEISYQGKPVKQLNLLEIKFINNGRDEIRKYDFELPLEVTFSDVGTFFAAELTSCNPDDLKVILNIDANKVVVEPLLLNPKDCFSIQMLFDGDEKSYKISGRIAGVKKIYFTQDPLKNMRQKAFWVAFFLIMLVGVLFIYTFLPLFLYDNINTSPLLVSLYLMPIVLVLLVYSLFPSLFPGKK